MEGIATEVSQKLKSAIKAKLMELGAYVDDELSNYVMVMVTNRRSKVEMDRELQLFLGGNTSAFTSWLQSVWMKLEQVTVTNSGIDSIKRKKKIKKNTKSSSESEDDKKPKKKRKASASDIAGKEVKKRKSSKVTTTGGVKTELFSEENLSDSPSIESKSALAPVTKKSKTPVTTIDEEDFLSIKEDFESEFLSDNDSIDVPVKSKSALNEPTATKKSLSSLKPESNEKTTVTDSSSLADKKHPSSRHVKVAAETSKDVPVIRRIGQPDGAKTSKIVLRKSTTVVGDHKAAPETAATSAAAAAAIITSSRKALIRERKLQSTRSRSQTPIKVLRSKSRSPALVAPSLKAARQRSRSRLRSRSPPSPSPPQTIKRIRTGSISQSSQPVTRGGYAIKARSRSPGAAVKYTNAGGENSSSTVLDARELINRKRAMVGAATEQSSSSAKEEKTLTSKRTLLLRKREIVDVDDEVAGAGKQKSVMSRLKSPIDSGGVIRLKSRERFKENVNVENSKNFGNVVDDDDDGDDDDDDVDDERKTEPENGKKNSSRGGSVDSATDSDRDDDDHYDSNEKSKKKNQFGRFVVSQEGGTRSVTMRSALSKKSAMANANKSDARGIRRTVYNEEDVAESGAVDEYVEEVNVNDDDGDVKNNKDEISKKRKTFASQIAKYIKEDPPVNLNQSKVGKMTRTKVGNVPSVSSTLIRKAMADAHKSMNSSKEEATKKREQHESKVTVSNTQVSEERITNVNHDPSDTDEPMIADETDENQISGDEMQADADIEYNPEENPSLRRDLDIMMDSTEEYDPSKNMPQFVVTLTGLDPKLFPSEDMDLADIDPSADDIRLKPKSQERCKFYPNCLAGEACLFYHPVIPCKMFPSCKYGNNCLYIHPKCKYDAFCTRYDCTYMHSSPRVAPPVPARHPIASGGMNSQPCKYYYNCVNPVCPFQHPKICRYDRFCTNKNCTFSHTSLSHVGSQVKQYGVSMDKLKWCRPKEVSETRNEASEQKLDANAAADI